MIRTTITISRQMGAGGSYIGQIIAKQLGLKYVDREVLHLAAQEFGCDQETIEAAPKGFNHSGSAFWAYSLWVALMRCIIRRHCKVFLIAGSTINRPRF